MLYFFQGNIGGCEECFRLVNIVNFQNYKEALGFWGSKFQFLNTKKCMRSESQKLHYRSPEYLSGSDEVISYGRKQPV